MPSSRRYFLRTVTAGALGLGYSTMVSANAPSVLVLGAGMAGLAAARHLSAQGFQVTVLEGRERIGGRIYTSRLWSDAPVDLGASWIHGDEDNPITELANQANAKRVATSYDSAELYIAPELLQQGVTDTAEDKMERLVDKALKQASDLDQDLSLRTAVERVMRDRDSTSLGSKAQLEFYLNSRYEQEYSGSTRELSAHTIDEDEEFEGDELLFPQGYGQLTDYLAKGLTIKTGQVVKQVAYSPQGVSVTTQNAQYSADYVLVTLPLGVLKRNSVQFNPPLPTNKQQAIARLGMGVLDKVFFRFDKVFWPKDIDWHEYLSLRAGRWVEWVSFAKLGVPILLGFNAAERARELELWSDQAIIEDGMQVLREMFGNAIPSPKATQITRWARDPFSYGSYSFNAVGSTKQDRKVLASTVAGRLFWAGEATHSEYPGTVHGAYLSGIAAAKRLLKQP
ncbi:flavin monoamine oxidase family protein [Thiofilum flexile]|uniref:flavin monoamine oxidase family protein n=1 Tax=Thiofilum flexile TaxID=125627 RepID=UPI000369B042|nr:NAD(P)/FAD-dependent oxidoreductase [Thiofilum flexile]